MEPDARNFEVLAECVRQSPFANKVKMYQVALGDTNGELTFWAAGNMGSYIAPDGNQKVSARCLDDMGLKIIGRPAIKMDVEGLELETLTGAEN